MKRLRDPKVWIGLAITALCLWLALRDVSFAQVASDVAGARWGLLLAVSVPSYVASVYFRALRWRHLTDPIQRIATPPLFRATAVGFMANNLIPLRVGEVIRAWYLARDTGADGTALFGSVVLERVIDSLCFGLMIMVIVGVYGARLGATGSLAVGLPLLGVLSLPLLFVAALRLAPDRTIRLVTVAAGPFPAQVGDRLELLLRRFAEGLGALNRGGHLFWIALHSALIWLVASMLPFWAAIVALGIDVGSPSRAIAVSYVLLAAVGIAVALPSAPGFFGPYHLACRAALSRFGVPDAQAVAMGTLSHAVFWVTLTLLGLAVLRLRRTSLHELEEVAESGKDSLPDRR